MILRPINSLYNTLRKCFRLLTKYSFPEKSKLRRKSFKTYPPPDLIYLETLETSCKAPNEGIKPTQVALNLLPVAVLLLSPWQLVITY